MTSQTRIQLPAFSLSNLPDPKDYRDQEIVQVAADGTRSVLFSNGIVWGAVGGGSSRTYRGIVADQAAMVALTSAGISDWVKRADLAGQAYELTALPASSAANWTPTNIGLNPPDTETASFNITRIPHANADVGYNSATAGAGTFNGSSGYLHKEGTRFMQQGAGAFTLAITGVNFINSYALNLTTQLPGDYIDVEWDQNQSAGAGALVVTSTGSRQSTVPSILRQLISQYGFSIPERTGVTTFNVAGMPGAATAGAAATACATSDGTAGYGTLRRVRYPASGTGAGLQGGLSWPFTFRPAVGGDFNGGFPVLLTAAIADTSPSSGTFFLGLGNAIANTATLDPSAYVAACIGICKDTADANFSTLNGGGSVAPNKVGLGASFVAAQYKAVAVLIDKNSSGSSFYVTPYYLDSATDLWVAGPMSTFTTNIPTSAATNLFPLCIRADLPGGFTPTVDAMGVYRGRAA